MPGNSLDTPYRGGFVGREHRFALTVYFEDTDAYGIVYYANYLKFMERARSDMIRAVGVDQAAELGASGSAYAVVEVDIRYRRPGRLGDDLRVVSQVQQVRASSVDIHQRVHARAGTVDRCPGDGSLPRRPGPSAAATEGLGREIQGYHCAGSMKRLLLPLLLLASGAEAQPAPPITVAIPPLTSPDSGTRGNEMLAVGWNATQVIAADLGQTTELSPLKPNHDDYYAYPEVTAPTFSKWRPRGAKALVMGFVQSRADGRLTFGCYVYDVDKGRELARKGFVITPGEWRRAAHKCSGVAYAALTGAPGTFDTRIAYIAESGAGEARVKRVAVMDSDGQNHRLVTPASAIALSPRFAPHGQQLAYVSFAGGDPNVRIVDLGTLKERPLLASGVVSFSPRYSPDGGRIVFSMMNGGNSDIYVVDASRRNAAPAHDFAGDRYVAELLARWQPDRVRKRPQRIAAALYHERRRHRRAADQLRQCRLCGARLESRRAMDRLHPARAGKPASRSHSARRDRGIDPDLGPSR